MTPLDVVCLCLGPSIALTLWFAVKGVAVTIRDRRARTSDRSWVQHCATALGAGNNEPHPELVAADMQLWEIEAGWLA